MRNGEYLLATLWILVLIGTIASSSYQHVSASPEKAACATGLENLDYTMAMDILSDSVLCLYRSGPDTTMRETCVTDLLTVKESPIVQATVYMDAISDAIICLAQTDKATTTCTANLGRLKDPDLPFGEVLNIVSKSIICLAST